MNTTKQKRSASRKRNRLVIRTKTSPRKVVYMIAGSMMGFIISMIFFLNSNPKFAYGANSGDYRSLISGNWNSTSTWETYNGSSWIAASSTPSSSSGAINILSGHTVTVSASVTADQLNVDAGGTLVVSSGKTLTIANGSSDDLIVNGTMTVNGTVANQASSTVQDNGMFTLSSGGAHTFAALSTITVSNTYKASDNSFTATSGIWTIQSGATFQYNANGGNIPLATWNTGSTCLVTGITGTIPGNLTQNFYNFKWNCASQASTEKLAGNLTTINGDFTMISSGTGRLRISQQENYTLNIGGNFYMQGGSLYGSCKGASVIINVTGDYIQTGGTFALTDGTTEGGTSPTVLSVTNFSLSSGTFDMTSNVGTASGNGVTTLNISSNYTQTGGTFTETATSGANYGYGKVYFTKTGTQTFTRSSGTMSGINNFTVNSTSILDFGTNIIGGSGTFTLTSGGGLLMAHTSGITASSADGNVQVTGTRTFSTGGDYTYNANAAQVTGNGLPSTVHNLTKNNSGDLTLTNTVAVSNILTLSNGVIKTGSNEVGVTNTNTTSISGFSSSSYVIGNLRRSVNSIGTYDFPLGSTSNYELMSVTLTNIAGFSDLLATFESSNPALNGLANGLLKNGRYYNKMLNHGYWTLEPNSNLTSGSYGVALNATGYSNISEMSALAASDVIVLKRHGNGNNWDIMGSPDPSKESMQSNKIVSACSGLTSFSHFGQAGGGSTLPIKLISFNAKLKENTVDLSWVTGTEINNDYFTVERSTDGSHYTEILRLRGAGNSTQTLNYSDNDDSPNSGYNYYRLKQTDFDGHYSYSSVRTVRLKNKPGESPDLKVESVYPNPFRESFKLDFTTNKSSNVNIIVYNQTGQTVSEEKFETNEGNNTYEFFEGDNLAKGIYFVAIMKDEQKIIKRIIKN